MTLLIETTGSAQRLKDIFIFGLDNWAFTAKVAIFAFITIAGFLLFKSNTRAK